MATDALGPNLLLQITLCKTKNPTVSRVLVVPSQMTFMELHQAIAAAFGWDIEPCTSWVFKKVETNPLDPPHSQDPNNLHTNFATLWTAPNQGYNVKPGQYGTQFAIGLSMNNIGISKYWTYDYNNAKHPHAIEVIEILADESDYKLSCVGGFGYISRNAWQFAELSGFETEIKVGSATWVGANEAMKSKTDGIQKKFEERREMEVKAEAEAGVAAKPRIVPDKRAVPLGERTSEEEDGGQSASKRVAKDGSRRRARRATVEDESS